MRLKITLSLLLTCLFVQENYAQTIWSGPKMTFTKADGADWTQAANQDRITDSLWITRANNQGIFNIAQEPDYNDFESPKNSEWALGTTANIASLTFADWESAIAGNPPGSVGQDMVLHIISDDIYIDIKFLSWASGGAGGQGGFSYERTTPAGGIGIDETPVYETLLSVFPNPAGDFLSVDVTKTEIISISDLSGKTILETEIAPGASIDISSLEKGVYFIRTEQSGFTKFVKS